MASVVLSGKCHDTLECVHVCSELWVQSERLHCSRRGLVLPSAPSGQPSAARSHQVLRTLTPELLQAICVACMKEHTAAKLDFTSLSTGIHNLNFMGLQYQSISSWQPAMGQSTIIYQGMRVIYLAIKVMLAMQRHSHWPPLSCYGHQFCLLQGQQTLDSVHTQYVIQQKISQKRQLNL